MIKWKEVRGEEEHSGRGVLKGGRGGGRKKNGSGREKVRSERMKWIKEEKGIDHK